MGERVNGIHEVRGSIPLASTAGGQVVRHWQSVESIPLGGYIWAARGNSSVGRAQPCQGWGRGFESRFPLSRD